MLTWQITNHNMPNQTSNGLPVQIKQPGRERRGPRRPRLQMAKPNRRL